MCKAVGTARSLAWGLILIFFRRRLVRSSARYLDLKFDTSLLKLIGLSKKWCFFQTRIFLNVVLHRKHYGFCRFWWFLVVFYKVLIGKCQTSNQDISKMSKPNLFRKNEGWTPSQRTCCSDTITHKNMSCEKIFCEAGTLIRDTE